MNQPRRLILADDHEIVREALRLLLEREGQYTIVGEAADGEALLELVQSHSPDGVVLDLSMPRMSGVRAAQELRTRGYVGGIVVLSAHEELSRVAEALHAGVDGYVLKVHAFAQLRAALEAAVRRERYLSPEIPVADLLVETTRGGAIAGLTAREREVLQLVAQGNGTKEIAFRLGVSPKTIESHRLNLMRKLAVNNVADLTRLALREGLISL